MTLASTDSDNSGNDVDTAARETAPPVRKLQIFSFDPSTDVDLRTASVSRSTLDVRWEDVGVGPVGEYVEVIDIDPSSGCVYDPVDLNAEHLLAQDGLVPSTGNPMFHQQMTYAVVMKTVENFEQALGRPIFWAERREDDSGKHFTTAEERYVQRLRIYPHALREENAYYSPVRLSGNLAAGVQKVRVPSESERGPFRTRALRLALSPATTCRSSARTMSRDRPSVRCVGAYTPLVQSPRKTPPQRPDDEAGIMTR
jgi:hypothetical protein